jgi:hypothetical protein
VILEVCDVVDNFCIGDIITIPLDHKNIYLTLFHQCFLRNPNIYPFGNFMEVNKITYVKKGDGDYWFVNLVCMVAKLVRNMFAILLYFHKLFSWSLFWNKLGDLASV